MKARKRSTENRKKKCVGNFSSKFFHFFFVLRQLHLPILYTPFSWGASSPTDGSNCFWIETQANWLLAIRKVNKKKLLNVSE